MNWPTDIRRGWEKSGQAKRSRSSSEMGGTSGSVESVRNVAQNFMATGLTA